jgi:hypothetical protein
MATAPRPTKQQCQQQPKVFTLHYKGSIDGRMMAKDANAEHNVYRVDYNSKTGILRAYARNRRTVLKFVPILDRGDHDHGLTIANILTGLGFFRASGYAYHEAVNAFSNFHIKKHDADQDNIIEGKKRVPTP